MSPSSRANWRGYYERTGDRPPRPTLLFALDQFPTGGAQEAPIAVDLGCGGGRDVVELLRRGWTVHGVDQSEDAGPAITARADFPASGTFHFLHGRFETVEWPLNHLTNSSFALPLCSPNLFDHLWSQITARLLPGGRFAGQLYGPRDSWFGRDGITFHTRDQVEALLKGWDIELLEEEENDSTTPRGTPKHWHIWHVVARRP